MNRQASLVHETPYDKMIAYMQGYPCSTVHLILLHKNLLCCCTTPIDKIPAIPPSTPIHFILLHIAYGLCERCMDIYRLSNADTAVQSNLRLCGRKVALIMWTNLDTNTYRGIDFHSFATLQQQKRSYEQHLKKISHTFNPSVDAAHTRCRRTINIERCEPQECSPAQRRWSRVRV